MLQNDRPRNPRPGFEAQDSSTGTQTNRSPLLITLHYSFLYLRLIQAGVGEGLGPARFIIVFAQSFVPPVSICCSIQPCRLVKEKEKAWDLCTIASPPLRALFPRSLSVAAPGPCLLQADEGEGVGPVGVQHGDLLPQPRQPQVGAGGVAGHGEQPGRGPSSRAC